MKTLKSIFFILITLSGVVVAYFAYLAFDASNLEDTGLFLAGSLALISFGLVMLIQTTTRQTNMTDETPDSIPVIVKPVLNEPILETVQTIDPLNESVNVKEESIASDLPDDVTLEPLIVEPVVIEPVVVEQEVVDPVVMEQVIVEPVVEIKEDPKLLFDDWYVDESGLYIDFRLIGITGRKSQKSLRKLTKENRLDYQVDNKTENIGILEGKILLGLVPELYRKSILTYIHWVESVHMESMSKRGRDVLQCIVRIRFKDELREKLQKKLQQASWY
jgi:hypothetical protein